MRWGSERWQQSGDKGEGAYSSERRKLEERQRERGEIERERERENRIR